MVSVLNAKDGKQPEEKGNSWKITCVRVLRYTSIDKINDGIRRFNPAGKWQKKLEG